MKTVLKPVVKRTRARIATPATEQGLSARETALLANFRKCHPQHQAIFCMTMQSLAKEYQEEQASKTTRPALRLVKGGANG